MARQTEAKSTNGRGRPRTPEPEPEIKELPVEETGREKFMRIAEYRVNKILDMITTLGKLATGKSKYVYDNSDIEQIRVTLIEAVNDAATRLRRDPLSKAGFSFGKGDNKDGPRA